MQATRRRSRLPSSDHVRKTRPAPRKRRPGTLTLPSSSTAALADAAEALRAIFEFIEVSYNPQRLRSSLGYLRAAEYEAQKEAQPETAQAA